MNTAKERQVLALRDVARAALALARYVEGDGTEAHEHLRLGAYGQAVNRAEEQVLGHPGERRECDCTLPLVFTDGWSPLPPRPDCSECQGSGVVEHWTPALEGNTPLFDLPGLSDLNLDPVGVPVWSEIPASEALLGIVWQLVRPWGDRPGYSCLCCGGVGERVEQVRHSSVCSLLVLIRAVREPRSFTDREVSSMVFDAIRAPMGTVPDSCAEVYRAAVERL